MRAAILSAFALFLCATTAFGQPPKAAPKVETPPPIIIGPIDLCRLSEAVDYVADKLRITIAIDSKGIAEGEKPFADRRITFAKKMKSPPAGFLVECLAQTVGATSRKDGNRYVIETGQPKNLAGLLSAPSPKALANAAKLVPFERPIVPLPLRELLDIVGEMHNLEIYLDEVGFHRVKKVKSVGDMPVAQLPLVSTVEKLLTSVMNPFGGKVIVREEMILIVPDAKPGG